MIDDCIIKGMIIGYTLATCVSGFAVYYVAKDYIITKKVD